MAYSVSDYANMLGDARRMRSYLPAIQSVTTADSVVLDLGAGTGFFAIYAALQGARHVYAIEPNPCIAYGKRLAGQLGIADRMTFIQDSSLAVELPEQVDIIISDLRDRLPFSNHNIPVITDARTRFLKPGGILMPLRDRVRVAAVSAAAEYAALTAPWRPYVATDAWVSWTRELANTPAWVARSAFDLASDSGDIATLDYTTIQSPNVTATTPLTLSLDGPVHGLCVWFDATVVPGITYSGLDDSTRDVYGRMFFPFEAPLNCRDGERLTIDFGAYLIGAEYVYRWNYTHQSATGEQLASGQQSTLNAMPLMLPSQAGVPLDGCAEVNDDGRLLAYILTALDAGTTIADIASAVRQRFPARATDDGSARSLVRRLASPYLASRESSAQES